MNTRSDENALKKRRVRKGTHSCWECRRRKVKCTFSSSKDTVCITCFQRGSKCVSQVAFPGSRTPEGDIGRNEQDAACHDDFVSANRDNDNSRLRKAVASHVASTSSSSPPTPASTQYGGSMEFVTNLRYNEQTNRSSSLVTTPELPPTPASMHGPIGEQNTHSKITQTLLRALPCRKDIEILLTRVNQVSLVCYRSKSRIRNPSIKDMPDVTSQADLLHPEGHPVLLARQMLFFVVALQYLPPLAAIPGLTKHHHVIMEELAESAIRMVTTNDELLGTLEGLENIILEAIYHVDSGNTRRAWVTMRRAVAVAQLQCLHRPGHYRFKVINKQNDLDPELMWGSIVFIERLLSLLQGLPTSTGTASSGTLEATGATARDNNLLSLMSNTTAKIIERNQIQVTQQALDMTREIDGQVIKMTEQLPPTFWRPVALGGLEADSDSAISETQRAMDHMCYYTMVNQLHLPYMLNPSHASQMVYSRIACVNASREILTREIAIRTFNPITAACRFGDFMALVAGMTLMLAHVISHCNKEVDNVLVHQRQGDRATVECALECMTVMSELQQDVLAARCAVILKDLLAIEADAAQGHHREQKTDGDSREDCKVLMIQVPYIGTIRIAGGGITSVAPSDTEHDRDHRDGVTIGGIGSMHVNDQRSPGHAESTGTSGGAAPQAVTQQPIEGLCSPSRTTYTAQGTSGDHFVQHDQILPGAAASLDNWVFQGFDTAFFDVLMSGAGDSQSNGEGPQGWNFNTFS